MLRYLSLTFLAFALSTFCYSQDIQLSDKAEILIITCGPGQDELYAAFGHSAVRVYDPLQRLDLVYNYGIFDFDQPNFYSNFAKGYLHYKLGVSRYEWFKAYYIKNNRFIHEQLLSLNQQQKQKFFDFLQWNAKPENQYYMYDYFYDNCATRVRDAAIKALGEDVSFDTSYFKEDLTIRELTDKYLGQQPWGDFGIDLALGLPMDHKADGWIAMYLPDYLEQGFDNATINIDGNKVPIVKETIVTYDAKPASESGQIVTPLFITLLILGLVVLITFFDIKKGRHRNDLDVPLFAITGLAGTVFFLIWVATDHKAAANNFNLLWAVPLHLPMAFLLLLKKKPPFISKYFLASFGLCCLVILGWFFLPQKLHYSLIPFVIALGLRSWLIFMVEKKNA